MKRKCLLFLLFFAFTALSARVRTFSEMQRAASSVLGQTNITRGLSAENGGNFKILHQSEMLTVLGDNNRFAVIANDDVFSAVIGYADGVFGQNPALDWFVSAADESMKSRLNDGIINHAPIRPNTDKFMSNVEPLLATTWNQDKPYNNLCPKDNRGNSYPSGCVATALAQIMKYYNYPKQGYGKKQYSFKPADGVGQLLSADFGATTYDWNKMLDNYVVNSYSDEEANAVAVLMLHTGVAVEMQYTPTGSGAYSSEARNGLIQYFRYNENIGVIYRDYYSQEEWLNIIFTELNNNRPIYYAGADATRGGHAFVIDGYDNEGLMHVNWGWGANGGNGYFDIALLNPSGYSFNIGQNMLIGIDLPEADIKYESHLVSDDDFKASKVSKFLNVSVGNTIWNLNGDEWTGELGVIIQGNGKNYILAQKTVRATADRYNVLGNIDGTLGGLLQMPKDITDGEYRLFVGAKNSHDKEWSLVRRSKGLINSYIIRISNDTFTIESDSDDTWTSLKPAINRNDNIVNYYDLKGNVVRENKHGIIISKQGDRVKKVFNK